VVQDLLTLMWGLFSGPTVAGEETKS
jgi:hypothetical protein